MMASIKSHCESNGESLLTMSRVGPYRFPLHRELDSGFRRNDEFMEFDFYEAIKLRGENICFVAAMREKYYGSTSVNEKLQMWIIRKNFGENISADEGWLPTFIIANCRQL